MSLTLAEARTIIDAATQRAHELGARPAISVVDATGRVVSVDQLDGAKLHRDRMATGKAMAAVVLEKPTSEIDEVQRSQPTRFHALLSMFSGQLYLAPGGLLLEADGEMVGAVGVAGAKAGADATIAEAGIAAWRR